MSHTRRGLSQEELEIQQILSPGSQSTVSAHLPSARLSNNAPAPAPPPTTLSVECMRDFALIMKEALSDVLIGARGSKSKDAARDRRGDFSESPEETETEESAGEMEVVAESGLPSGGPAGARAKSALPKFGVWVNEDPDYNNNNNNVEVDGASLPAAVIEHDYAQPPNDGIAVDPTPPVVQPDSTLPLPSSRPTTNWYPDPETLQWALLTLDGCEWSEQDREVLVKQFSPDIKYDHVFTAVPCPPDMKLAICHSETKRRDYKFRREETENFLFEANKDLACGIRPLLEVLSSLKNVPGMEDSRLLLARVFQSMASSASYLSRGRRELGRRFVPAANVGPLFDKKPSHHCFFGSDSVKSAVTSAVSAAQVNKDLVIMPKRRILPFRDAHPGGKNAWRGGSHRGRLSGKTSNFQSGQGGRGKGRGKRRGKRNSAPKTTSQE